MATLLKKYRDMDLKELNREKLMFTINNLIGLCVFSALLVASLLLYPTPSTSPNQVNPAIIVRPVQLPLPPDPLQLLTISVATVILAFTSFQFTLLNRVVIEIRLREFLEEMKK